LYVLDVKTGKFLETKDKRKQKRPAGSKTPCWECPKQSPENEKNCQLSERNIKTLELYYRFRACGWDGLPASCRGDSIVVRNFAIIDKIIRQQDYSAT
jgi:hypothetical protein